MNEPGEARLEPDNNRKKNPYTLWFVILAFAGPVVLAYGMYFLNYTPSTYSNFGELIEPVIDVGSLELKDADGAALDREEATIHKWHMVYFATASCDDSCQNTLLNMRQINKIVGKHAYRLRRLIVHLEAPDSEFAALLENVYPEARRAYTDAATARSAMAPVSETITADEIYVMDPLGNIMMRYEGGAEYHWLVDDFRKLFKVSQIG